MGNVDSSSTIEGRSERCEDASSRPDREECNSNEGNGEANSAFYEANHLSERKEASSLSPAESKEAASNEDEDEPNVHEVYLDAVQRQGVVHKQARPENTSNSYKAPQNEFFAWAAADYRYNRIKLHGCDVCEMYESQTGKEKTKMPVDVEREAVFLYAQTYLTRRPVSGNNKKLLEMQSIRSAISALSDLHASQKSEKREEIVEGALWDRELKILLQDEEQRRLSIQDTGAYDYAGE